MPRSLRFLLPLAILLALAPAAHARLPAGFVGITSEDVFAGDEAYRSETLADQRAVRVGLIRQVFDWSLIETARGRYDFSEYDSYMLALAANRMRVLPILFRPPRFQARRRSGTTCPPSSNASFASFAQAVVRRYGPRGSLWRENPDVPKVPLGSYQIWNEPQLRQYWCNKPNAKQYVAMLKTVGGAIKRAQRGAEIVTAGLPPSKLSGAVAFRKYIRQMYAAGAKRYFDTLAVNSYAQGAAQLGRLLDAVRGLMNERGDRRAKIWITELGWGDSGVRHRFIVGARGQAQRISQSLALIDKRKKRYKLRGVVYYQWRDAEPYGGRDMWGFHTGLLRKDGSPKPAFNAFRSGVKKL